MTHSHTNSSHTPLTLLLQHSCRSTVVFVHRCFFLFWELLQRLTPTHTSHWSRLARSLNEFFVRELFRIVRSAVAALCPPFSSWLSRDTPDCRGVSATLLLPAGKQRILPMTRSTSHLCDALFFVCCVPVPAPPAGLPHSSLQNSLSWLQPTARGKQREAQLLHTRPSPGPRRK